MPAKVNHSHTIGTKRLYWGYTPDAKTGYYKGRTTVELCVKGYYVGLLKQMDDDAARVAKAELFAAIRHYYQQVEPDEYVTGYVLITHRDTQGDFHEDNSYVGVVAPDGQSFVVTRGLLAIAAEGETLSTGFEGEGD